MQTREQRLAHADQLVTNYLAFSALADSHMRKAERLRGIIIGAAIVAPILGVILPAGLILAGL